MNKERTFFEIIKRFTDPLWKNTIITLQSILFYSVWALWPLVHVYFAQAIVSTIENKNEQDFFNYIIFYSIFLFFFYGIWFLTRFWWANNNITAFRMTVHNLYLKKFIKLSNTQTEKIGTSKLISIIWTWIDTWAMLLNKTIENFMKVFFAVIFTVYMIAIVNIWAALVFFILYFLIHFIWWYFNKNSLVHRRKRQNVWNTYTWSLVKIIMSKFEILQTWKINIEIKKINKIEGKLLIYTMKMATPTHWFYYTPSIFINIIKILMFLFLWYQVILWNATISLFVAMFWILTLMNQVIINSMIFFSELTKDFTKIEKLWDFFDETEDIKWYDDWKDFEYKNWNIKLENINFWYSEKNQIFKDFSLNIKGWKISALVGNSGSWKSTLVKLISGYIKPDSWNIIIDDQKLDKIKLKSFYKNIWYLTQEPSVFDGSILENLMYGISENVGSAGLQTLHKNSRDVWQKHLNQAIKKAKCEFIYDLEDWINTEIWEKWIRLSWGQRQRLAIAKIFLKDPKIIILDEPTSALDSFSEEQITKSLNNLFKWRTVIIIAHRLQTVKNANEIFVLENWKIKEKWNHNELVEKNWIYKKMLDLQSGF